MKLSKRLAAVPPPALALTALLAAPASAATAPNTFNETAFNEARAMRLLARAETSLHAANLDLEQLRIGIAAGRAERDALNALDQVDRALLELRSGRPQAANAPAAAPTPTSSHSSAATPAASGGAHSASAAPPGNSIGGAGAGANSASATPATGASSAATTGSGTTPAGSAGGNAGSTMGSSGSGQASGNQLASTSTGGSAGVAAANSAPTAPKILPPEDGRKFLGKTVVNSNGQTLGDLQKVVTAPDGKTVAVIAHGGFLGLFQDHSAIPWDQTGAHMQGDNLVFDLSPQQVQDAPQYNGS